jgi:hypothetical protein
MRLERKLEAIDEQPDFSPRPMLQGLHAKPAHA